MGVLVVLRTGEMLDASAAGFAVMPTTILFQDDAPPEVAGQFEQFFRDRHRLVKVGQEVAKRLFCHKTSLFIIAIFLTRVYLLAGAQIYRRGVAREENSETTKVPEFSIVQYYS